MAITKIKLKQVENSATPGSIVATDASNVVSFVVPNTAANHVWYYNAADDVNYPLLIGTNLSIDTGTHTLNASAGSGGYSEVQEEGSPVTTRTKINFIGTGITASDDGANTRTNVTLATKLNNLASMNSTAGLVVQDGTDTFTKRTLTGTTDRITITNGDGVSGNPTVDIASTYVGQASITTLGTVTTGTWNATAVGPTFGGTGITSYTTGDTLYASATNVLSKLAIGSPNQVLKVSGGIPSWGSVAATELSDYANVGMVNENETVSGNWTFSNNITLNGTPSAGTDVVNVNYVNNILSGTKWKTQQVRVATTTAGTLASSFENGDTIDGITLQTGDRILIKNQAAPAENGIYTVNASGAPTRATDADTWDKLVSAAVAVSVGTENADSGWLCTADAGGTLGTTAVNWIKLFSSTGAVDGTGVANKVAYWQDSDTITSTTNFHFDGTQLALGTATPASSTMFTTQGTGTGPTTYGYRHNNSSGTQVFRIANDGTTIIGNSPSLILTGSTVSASSALTVSATTITLTPTSGSNVVVNNGNGGTLTFGSGYTWPNTSGVQRIAFSNPNITPTSGSAQFTILGLGGTINQTGGANGITRGLHINPTLTAAADYRGIEVTTNSSHYSFYSTAGKIRWDLGSDANYDMYYRGTGGEIIRLPIGATSGHVLTSNGTGSAPSWQAPAGGSITRGYVTGTGTDTYDLDAGTVVKDIDGTGFSFTVPSDLDKVFIYRNGVLLSRSGTVSRDYTLNSGTGVLVLATNLESDETLTIYKIV